MEKLTPNHFITEEAREAYLALLEAIEEEGGNMAEVKEWLMEGEPGTWNIMRVKELAEHIIFRITLEAQEEVYKEIEKL